MNTALCPVWIVQTHVPELLEKKTGYFLYNFGMISFQKVWKFKLKILLNLIQEPQPPRLHAAVSESLSKYVMRDMSVLLISRMFSAVLVARRQPTAANAVAPIQREKHWSVIKHIQCVVGCIIKYLQSQYIHIIDTLLHNQVWIIDTGFYVENIKSHQPNETTQNKVPEEGPSS